MALSLAMALFVMLPVQAQETQAQEQQETQAPEKAKKEKKKKEVVRDANGNIIKTGFSLGVLPAISYNTDMGLQYGLIVNLFNYGDGSRYPTYDRSLYIEGSMYTKGAYTARIYFDSDRLIKGVHSFIDAGFIGNQLQDFYGFNGYASRYTFSNTNSLWCDRIYDAEAGKASKYGTGFYRMNQKRLYLQGDFSGSLGVKNLNWLGGLGVYNYWVKGLNYDKYDKMNPETASLYETYKVVGLIDEKEADGGFLTTLRAGILYDSRTVQTNPSRGIYTEALLEWAIPGISESPYLAYAVTHRQYVPLAKKLTFAYRLAAQGTIGANRMPFYRMSQMIVPFAKRSVTFGVGGGYTVRGVLQDRMVADAVSYANIELRWKIVNFNIGKQAFYVGVNPFFDAGYTLNKVKFDETELKNNWDIMTTTATLKSIMAGDRPIVYPNYEDCFTGTNDGLHMAAGLGLKIAMNENFVLSADFGKAFKKEDNNGLGVYVMINYLF